MELQRFCRPVRCRLCRCPVVDGGVRIVDLDKEALAAWWLQHLGVEFDRQRKLLGRICAFCVWDARYVDGDLNTDRDKSLIFFSWMQILT
jgi:hypothetical protein